MPAPIDPPLPRIPFFRPDIGEEEIAAVVETLRSGWLTSGPRCAELETAFAAFVGGDVQAVTVSSATAGLELALRTLGVGDGVEVIAPTYTFTATVEAILRCGARPVLVDVDARTLNMDPDLCEAAVTPRTRTILPVHFAGLPCDMTALQAIADRHGLLIVEDAAHALPARHAGRTIGSGTADATVFSFYANKTITTGEGGMVTFRDPALARRARMLRLHGISREGIAFDPSGGDSWRYEVAAEGMKANLSDILAAIGCVQLRRAWEFLHRREAICRHYDAALAQVPLQRPAGAPADGLHARHLYFVQLTASTGPTRDAVCIALGRNGIQTSMHFSPIHRHPHWRQVLDLANARFPHADHAADTGFTLPVFTRMTDAEVARVSAALAQALRA